MMSVDINKRKDFDKSPSQPLLFYHTLPINKRKFLKMNGEWFNWI